VIKFACPKCGKHLRVDDKHAGKQGKCPGCREPLVVPNQATAIRFRCAGCGHRIKVPESYAGRRGRCPKCKEAVVVPAAKKEPAAEARTPAITCSMCGQTVSVPEGATDEFVECPECGSYLDPSSGEIVSPAREAILAGPEEELHEEPSETTREPTGVNRRLLLIISAVAVIVVVGVIGLIVVLKSLGPPAAERPEAQRAPRPVADTTLPSQPASPDVQPTEQPTVSPTAPAVHLRFAPNPGTKRTMRLSTTFITSVEELGQQQNVTALETFTFYLEATPARADGTVPLTVTLAAVQVKSAMQGTTTAEFDSTTTPAEADRYGELYAPFVGKRFTIDVSAQGEIVDFGLDALYRAVAEERVTAEDITIREDLEFKEKAETVIEGTNQRLGSEEDRVLAMKKQLEEFPVLGKDKLSTLLGELVVALPAKPLHKGDRWSRPVVIAQVDRRLEMATVYTVTAVKEKACTIRVEGLRSWDETPLVQELDQMKVSSELGGSCQATLTVDRQTGWLLSKEQKTTLTGQITTGAIDTADQDTSMPVALEITSTVTTLE